MSPADAIGAGLAWAAVAVVLLAGLGAVFGVVL